MRGRKSLIRIMSAIFITAIAFQGLTAAPGYGGEEEAMEGTRINPQDVYLNMEGLCGAEGLPYQYMTPAKEFVKTKLDPRDIYLDMEAMCGSEGLPYRYMIIPQKYVRIKNEPQDLMLDIEKMLTDDPSFVKGQEKY